MDRCEITQTGARLFAKKAMCLDGLRVLDVGFNHFRHAGVAALLDRRPPELHTLGLRDNDLFDDGVAVLAESPAGDVLRELDLSRNGLTTAAVLALCDTEHLANLVVLRITDNPLGEPGAAALSASTLAKRLAILETGYLPASGTPYGDDIPF